MSEIKIGVVGTGFIARNFMTSLDRHPDARIGAILTRRDPHTITDLPADLLTGSATGFLKSCDVVLECSGDPLWATEVISEAVAGGKPVVTMNTEFHITAGSALVGSGMITEAEGDQPGCLAALHEDAVAMGFAPLAYGNMKGFMNKDPSPEDMEFWGAKQGISLPMVTSFTDGTKVQAEQVLVGNHFGAAIIKEGMLGPDVAGQAEASEVLATHARELGRPVSDFVVSSALPHGVFIVAEHLGSQQAALEYYKMGPGPTYTIIKNNILVHLEIMKTVERIMNGGPVLLDNSATPELSLGAVAKRDLSPGDRIDQGIGSFDVRGHTVRIGDHPDHLPIGLISEGTIAEPLARGQLITQGDIETPDSLAKTLWNRDILALVRDDTQGPS